MTRNCHKTSAALLLGATVHDERGATLGHLQEFAVSPETDTAHVSTLVFRRKGSARRDPPVTVPTSEIHLTESGEIRLRPGAISALLQPENTFLMLERDLLDQQIIDVDGHKVVRVNDV